MEDEVGDTEQSGNTEAVAYMVFGSAGSYTINQLALDQTTYRFYQNATSVQPGSPLAGENTPITDVADNDIIRVRLALQVGLNDLPTSTQSFKFQYASTTDICTSSLNWYDVGQITSSTIWRGCDNSGVADGAQITASLLNSQTNTLESYEEQNNSVANPAAVTKGTRGEWDWVIENNGATGGTAYCFKMTLSDGSVIQYTNYPKLTTSAVNFPEVTNVSLNGGNNITLIEGSTTTILATATATDPQGYTDISTTTGKIYRSGVSGAENCTLNDNNCYEDALCATSSCAGNSCLVTCTFEVWFHAEPTDIGSPWSSQIWVAWIKTIDSSNASSSATNTTETVDIYTLRALSVTSNISYGIIDAGSDTGSFNPTTTVTDTGNSAIDLALSGTDLCTDYPTCSGGTIGVSNQEYSTSTFSWGTGIDLHSSTSTIDVDLPKPTSHPSTSTDIVYWGLGVPLDTPIGTYTGENTFTAVGE